MLGLGDKSARLARAREQGFDVDTVYYHGTDADIEAFELPAGTGIFASSSPDVGASYSGVAGEIGNPKAPVVYPVFINKTDFLRLRPYEPGQHYASIIIDGLTVELPDGSIKRARDVFQFPAENLYTSTDSLTAQARKQGRKGLIFEGIVDVGPGEGGLIRSRMQYLAEQGYPVNPTYNPPNNTFDDDSLSIREIADRIRQRKSDKTLYENVPKDLRTEARHYAYEQITQPSEVVVSLNPNNIRSINAKFDPEKSLSEDVLASAPPLLATAIGAAAVASPQDAEAGVLTASLSPVLRASMDAMLRGEELPKRQMNQLNKYLQQIAGDKTAFGRRERMRMQPGASQDVDVLQRDIIQPEDLQGSALVPIQGDPSIAGANLLDVEGVPLSAPVALQGGPNYSLMNADLNSLLGWASSQGAAQKLQNQITRAAGLSDDVRGVYARMGDESMKFNTMLVEAMVRQIPALGIAKKDINRFNADVRKSVPDFAGVETEEGLAQMKGLAPASKKGGKPVSPSDLRKLVVNKMDMKNDYGKVGFPSYEDTLRAITEPELRGLPRGESGFSTIKAFPGSALLDDAMHDTYSHGVKGIYGGGLEESVPYQVMFPDLYRATADLRVTQKNSARLGQPLNETERTGAVLLGGGAQKADQQWLDGVMTYLENKKKLGRAAAITLALSAGNANSIPPEDLDIQNEIDARRAGGRKYRRDNPPSGLLQQEAQSQVLPRAAEAGQGFVSGLLGGIDTFVQGMAAPDPRAAIASPQGYVDQMDTFIQNQQLPPTQNPNSMMSTPAMRGLLDQQYMQDAAERENVRRLGVNIGGLLAPI